MKTYLNKKNEIALFSGLNQGTKEFRMRCTIFFAITNAYFNGVLKEKPTYDDIRIIGKAQKNKGELDDSEGGYLIHSAQAVAEYYGLNLITFTKDDKLFDQFLDNGFMVGFGMSVNQDFYEDYKDGSLDKFQDYINYKGDRFKHALNLYRWKCRFEEKGCGDYNKEKIYDNYMGKEGRVNSIDVNIEEMKDVMYNTCYVFI